MPSPLESLSTVQAEPPDPVEFKGLLRSGDARLADAERSANSLESRFDLAYNASHVFCLAALRYRGYRSSKRYVVFQALPHTLGLGPEVWRVLDRAHNERNRGEYEGGFAPDERFLADLITACKAVRAALRKLPPLGPAS